MNNIIFISSICIAVSTILSCIFTVYKTIRNIEEKLSLWEENLNKNTLYILKLAVFSEGLPTIDRIQAGQQFLDIKHDYLVEKK